MDGRIVELDALTDADRAGTEDDDARLLRALIEELLRFVLIVIGCVEVRCFRREFRRAGIDHLVDRVAVHRHFFARQALNCLVRIAHLLRAQIRLRVDVALFQAAFHVVQVQVLMEEEVVDFRDFVQLFQRHAARNRLVHCKHALVGALADKLQQLVHAEVRHRLHPQCVAADFRAANRLHQRLLDVHANRHHLAGRLHLRAEGALAVHELVKRPLRDFRHDVVQRGFKRGAGLARHGVLHFIQRIADGNLRGALGNRVARRLRRKGGGTADARVDLDDGIVERIGIERELAVAAALDFQRGDDVQRGAAEHLILLVRQGQRGRNDDGVARVHADGVDVLHRADGNHVAQLVAHDLEFDFLPAGNALLDQNLCNRRQAQTILGDFRQFRFILADTAARTAQRVRWTHNHRVSDGLGERERILHRLHHFRRNDGLVDGEHRVLELLAVFRLFNRFALGAEQLHAVLFKEALLRQLHGEGQTALPAQRGQQGVRLFLEDDAAQGFQRQRLNVDMVGGGVVGHDGSGVRVDQHDFQPRVLQGAARLRTGVVKFGSLTNHNRAGADNHYFVQIGIQRHSLFPPIMAIKRSNRKRVSSGPPHASGWNWTENAGISV